MADELDGRGHNVEVQNGKEGGMGVHRGNAPKEFAIMPSRQNVVYTCFASPVEST